MDIGVIGINHKSADLRLREKLAKACERLFGPGHSVHTYFSSVLLSTCNRTEVYFHSNDPAATHTYLLNVLRHEIEEEFEHRIYSYFGNDCFFHLARVTAGFDSALIGETEIQGQVKRAYESAMVYRYLSSELHFLFQKCLKIGKNMRSIASFTHRMPSLQETILNVSCRLLSNDKNSKILFVGLSEINYKILHHFKRAGYHNVFICNRTHKKALLVSEKEKVQLLHWEDLNLWTTFDLAVFGTKCPNYLAAKEDLQGCVACKLVIDLSVPRNVDPKIGRHPGLTLLNVDQLNRAIGRKRKLKALEIARNEMPHIAAAVERQTAIFKLKGLQREIDSFRTSA